MLRGWALRGFHMRPSWWWKDCFVIYVTSLNTAGTGKEDDSDDKKTFLSN